MLGRAPSPPLTVTVLAALWVSLGRYLFGACEPPGPICDNGKLFLDMDLSADAVYWDCAVFAWPESTQRLQSIDSVYDPEPARQICMDKPIFYNHTLPSSGVYRPVRAESGEYLFCPPQRWLNNLHHGATVLLYHPCAPLHERYLLAGLARSCLQEYIMTPHPQLNKHMPIALVSWGHTLELPTVATSDICDWLDTTPTTRKLEDVTPIMKYNLLLTWSAELQQLEQSTKIKESLRQCCEQTISSLLSGAAEAEQEPSMKKDRLKQIKEGGKRRPIRVATREKWEKVKNIQRRSIPANVSSFLIDQTNRTIPQGTEDVRNYSNTLEPPAEKRTHLDPSSPRKPQSEIQNQGLTPRPAAQSENILGTDLVGFEGSQSKLKPSPKQTDLRKQDPSAGVHVPTDDEQKNTTQPEVLTVISKDEGTESIRHRDKDSVKHNRKVNDPKETIFNKERMADGKMKDNEVVDVKEREVEHKQMQSPTHPHHQSENTGFESVPKSQSESQPQQNPQPASRSQPRIRDCDGCKAGEHCDCTNASGVAVVTEGLPRTPRTDEAVWAAGALGFLLILLTLSVLHTRLYRHWTTTPSLYWRDPRQDYDSVADVIRRRLRIAKRRRKRSRRQECVLLPSSSSSDEDP